MYVVYQKVTAKGAETLGSLQGRRGGQAWFAEHGGIVPEFKKHYTILLLVVKSYPISGLESSTSLRGTRGSLRQRVSGPS